MINLISYLCVSLYYKYLSKFGSTGTLTVCENCASNYHVSCHSVSPAPPRICPKCALIEEEEIDDGDEGEEEGRPSFKKNEEFGKASLVFRKISTCSIKFIVIDKKVLVSCRH